jgi:hypothetical protein
VPLLCLAQLARFLESSASSAMVLAHALCRRRNSDLLCVCVQKTNVAVGLWPLLTQLSQKQGEVRILSKSCALSCIVLSLLQSLRLAHRASLVLEFSAPFVSLAEVTALLGSASEVCPPWFLVPANDHFFCRFGCTAWRKTPCPAAVLLLFGCWRLFCCTTSPPSLP